MASREAPLPKPQTAVEIPPPVDITSLLCPRAKPPPPRQKIKEGRLRHPPTLYRTRGPNCGESPAAIRCKPSRPQMPLPQAPSSRRCPTPHWSLPSNTSRRGPLQAAKRQPRDNPRSSAGKQPPQREPGNTLHACRVAEMPIPVGAAVDSGATLLRTKQGLKRRCLKQGNDAERRRHRSSSNWTGFSPRDLVRPVVAPKVTPPAGKNDVGDAVVTPPGGCW